MRGSSEVTALRRCHVIISCEGAGEEVAIRKLLSADALVFPRGHVIDITRKRKASEIQEEYLHYEYDWPVCILRILDSLRERFSLGPLYRDRYPVVSVYTRPEFEMLTIIRSGRYSDFAKVKSRMKPSQYCAEVLKLPSIKRTEFLQDYWDATSLAAAAIEYRRLAHLEKNEVCLADILK